MTDQEPTTTLAVIPPDAQWEALYHHGWHLLMFQTYNPAPGSTGAMRARWTNEDGEEVTVVVESRVRVASE